MKLGWNVLALAIVVAGIGGWTAIQKPKPSTKPAASQAKVKCPYCGTMNTAAAKSCTSCRGNLDFASYPSVTRLTKYDGRDIQPCWGPGGKIAYTSDLQGDSIWIMNGDGSNPTRVKGEGGMGDFQPSWSADGKLVVVGHGVSNDIYIMDTDGSNRKRLCDYSADDSNPARNGDGKIAFHSDRGRNSGYDIFVMDSDGENVVQLTKDVGSNSSPNWSPDGKQIVFHSDRDGNKDIFVMNADGTGAKKLTTNAAEDYSPHWGPDGRIVFVSERGKDSPDIFIMNADGSGQKQLTNNKWQDYWPRLGPEGKILFQSRRDAGKGFQEDIYLMRVPK